MRKIILLFILFNCKISFSQTYIFDMNETSGGNYIYQLIFNKKKY